MTTTSELVAVLRIGAESLDFPVRFMIEDACDRLERKSRDNELLMQLIAELKSRTVKTNADRIRAMSDEELAEFLYDDSDAMCRDKRVCSGCGCKDCTLDWLKQSAKDGENDAD